MILISCVENALGLLFNHRRCSRDRAVCGRILERAGNELWLAESSGGLFRDFPEEALQIVPDMSQEPEGLVLYFWNRDYPSDEKFVFPGGEDRWRLTAETDFEGFSHPQITERLYDRGE